MVEGDDEQRMRTAWHAAVRDCLTGHEHCTYGGMTPQTGYWLHTEGCQRNHGAWCVWCGGDADTGFVGWAEVGGAIYRVPACMGCARQWIRLDPRWQREDGEHG